MFGWIALAVTLAIFASIAFQIDDWGRDWTQNTASLQPDATRPGLRPLVLRAEPSTVVEALERWAENQSKWDVVSTQQDASEVRVELTRTTPLMRFVDDISVRVSPGDAAGTVIVNADSRSRVGKGDLGQNPRNLIELTSGLKTAFEDSP